MDDHGRPRWILIGITAAVAAYIIWRYNQSQSPPLLCAVAGGHFSWLTGWSCGR